MGVDASPGPAAVAVPDSLTTREWRISNRGDEPVSLALEVAGEPAAWSWLNPTSLTVPPGGTEIVRFVSRPPRATRPAAGPVPYQLRIRQAGAPDTVIDEVVTVGPFADVIAALAPRTVETSGAAEYALTLSNRGNAATRVKAEAVDTDEALSLAVEPETADIEPGEQATARITARPRRRTLRGDPRSHRFEMVATADGAPTVRCGATLVQHPSLPRWAAPLGVGLLVVALVVGALGLSGGGDPSPSADPATRGEELDRERPQIDPTCPGRNHLATEANGISRPGPAPFSYSFLFLKEDDCTPVRFNPCEPVHYVTNPSRATPEHLADLREALRRVTEVTGIEFVDEGPTDEEPGPRGPYVSRYGQRWAPVLIAYVGGDLIPGIVAATAGRNRELAVSTTTIPPSTITGAGTPIMVDDAYVSGMLLINVDARDPDTDRAIPHGFGPGVNWGRVLLHELGHLLGLGHVASRTAIMQHELGSQELPNANWGIGDTIALKAIGKDFGCGETPPFRLPGPRPTAPG